MSEPPEQQAGRPVAHTAADGPRTRATASPAPLIVAGICLAIPFVAMLWVDSYARVSPAFIGIPFFYWYQMLWVLIATLLTTIAYVLVRRRERLLKGGESK
ncbi:MULTISPECIES: DUF3311 domain-containing protein [Streptomyces]|uniref:DUF3311 domain-containing protein n=1 Tax=Streptomyces luteosporeus TaxID=173856 RepID=A0ABP6GGX8_9ACTN